MEASTGTVHQQVLSPKGSVIFLVKNGSRVQTILSNLAKTRRFQSRSILQTTLSGIQLFHETCPQKTLLGMWAAFRSIVVLTACSSVQCFSTSPASASSSFSKTNKEGPEKTNKLLLNLILQHMGPTGLNLQTTILTNQPVRNHCPGERFMAGAPLAPSS